jgi:anti-sigma-K factor RskA
VDAEAHELIAAYALDALEPDDVERAEELLRTSPEAREELRAFSDAVGGLAVAASGPAPPPELRDRVLAGARAETQNVVSLESRRRRVVPVLGAVASVAAVVAIGLGVYAFSLAGELDDTRTALEQQESAAAILADPSSRTVELQEGEGRLVVATGGDAVLVVDDLEPAPAGKTYQVWVVAHGGTPASAGLFGGSGGPSVVPVEAEVPPAAVVAVTVEEAGGAEQPTSEPVVASMPV